jgi:hypothetical protein
VSEPKLSAEVFLGGPAWRIEVSLRTGQNQRLALVLGHIVLTARSYGGNSVYRGQSNWDIVCLAVGLELREIFCSLARIPNVHCSSFPLPETSVIFSIDDARKHALVVEIPIDTDEHLALELVDHLHTIDPNFAAQTRVEFVDIVSVDSKIRDCVSRWQHAIQLDSQPSEFFEDDAQGVTLLVRW